jgi:hypothetical protein
MAAIAAAIGAAANFIPERQIKLPFSATILRGSDIPDDDADEKAIFDPFPVIPIENPNIETPKVQVRKPDMSKGQENKPRTSRPAEPKNNNRSVIPGGEDSKARGNSSNQEYENSTEDSAKSSGKNPEKGQGDGSGSSNTGEDPYGEIGGLDTDIIPIIATDVFDGLSEEQKLRRAQKFLSRSGVSMDAHLARVIRQMIDGSEVSEEDMEKAKKLNEKLRALIRSRGQGGEWQAVRTFLLRYYYGM